MAQRWSITHIPTTPQIAGVPDSAIATFFSIVFVEMDKAMVETVINGGT